MQLMVSAHSVAGDIGIQVNKQSQEQYLKIELPKTKSLRSLIHLPQIKRLH